MSFYALGSAEAGLAGTFCGVYKAISAFGHGVVATPFGAAPGTFSYSVDPVAGNAQDLYGWRAMFSPSSLVAVPFMFRFTEAGGAFDASVTIAELDNGTGFARRVVLTTTEQLAIADKDDASIGNTAANYLVVDTDYWFLWLVDLRVEASSQDTLWVWKAGAWDKAIDVSNHGNGSFIPMDAITFGTSFGKGRPTDGGPFYVDEMAVQVLNESPNRTALGSVTAAFKVPTANGTDGDFDTGTGANPDWNDVVDIPNDGVTSYDEGDVAGDEQSYAIANSGAGETPLAFQVIGAGARSGGTSLTPRVYVYDGTSRDYGPTWAQTTTLYRGLATEVEDTKTYNYVNGAPITKTLFDSLEAGVNITAIDGAAKYRFTQVGLEYIIDGPKALPGDFPTITFDSLPHQPGRAMRPLIVR